MLIYANDDKFVELVVDRVGIIFTIPTIKTIKDVKQRDNLMFYRIGYLDENEEKDKDVDICSKRTVYRALNAILNRRITSPSYVYYIPIWTYHRVTFVEVIDLKTGDVHYICNYNEPIEIEGNYVMTPYAKLNETNFIQVEDTDSDMCVIERVFYDMENRYNNGANLECSNSADLSATEKIKLPLQITENGMVWVNESHWIDVHQRMYPPQLSDPPVTFLNIRDLGISLLIREIGCSLCTANVEFMEWTCGLQQNRLLPKSPLYINYIENNNEKIAFVKQVKVLLSSYLIDSLVKHHLCGPWSESNLYVFRDDPCLRILYDFCTTNQYNEKSILGFVLQNIQPYISGKYLYIRSGSDKVPISKGSLYLPYKDTLSGPYVSICETRIKSEQGHTVLKLRHDNIFDIWKSGYFGGREFRKQFSVDNEELIQESLSYGSLHIFLSGEKIYIIHDSLPSYVLVAENWLRKEKFVEWKTKFYHLFDISDLSLTKKQK